MNRYIYYSLYLLKRYLLHVNNFTLARVSLQHTNDTHTFNFIFRVYILILWFCTSFFISVKVDRINTNFPIFPLVCGTIKGYERINTNSVCVYGVGWDHPALSLGLTECLSPERGSLNAGSLAAIWDWLSHWASLYGWQLLVLYVAPLAPGPPSFEPFFSASNI